MKDVKKASVERENAIKENANRHKKRRKRNLKLYYFLMAIVTICVIIVLSLTVFFKITDVKVDGVTDYFDDDIIAASGISTGDNLILTNPAKSEERILGTFLLIDDVDVKKIFPSHILVSVSPAKPFFQVCDDMGRYVTVSSNNKVISVSSDADESVMFINGMTFSDPKVGKMLGEALSGKEELIRNITSEFSKYEIEDIRGIDINSSADIRVNIEDRISVKLGSEAKLAYKIQLVSTVFNEKIEDGERGTIDATSAGSVAFRPE